LYILYGIVKVNVFLQARQNLWRYDIGSKCAVSVLLTCEDTSCSGKVLQE